MSRQIEEHPAYQSYLLRLWHTQSGGDLVWRAALEEPISQEVVRFDSLHSLFAYLLTQTGQDAPEGSLDREVPSLQPAPAHLLRREE